MHRYFEINGGGHNVRCKLYYSDLKDIRRCVVFCHGFSSDKDTGSAEKLAQRMLSKFKGCALVTFNWPCHGDDVKKVLRLSDCAEYLTLVVDHLRQRFGVETLYGCGTSFGGYMILNYIAQFGSPFRKIVLRCPAVNMHEALTQVIMEEGDFEKLRKSKSTTVGFDRKIPVSAAFLEELRSRDIRKLDYLDWAEDILIIQGTRDEVVPYAEVRGFAENQLTEFLAVEGADHRFRDPKKMEIVIKAILEFYGM